MRSLFTIVLAALVCAQGTRATGFGFVAHVGASKVAQQLLESDVKTEVERLLSAVKSELEAAYTRNGDDQPAAAGIVTDKDSLFVRASIYPDLIRDRATAPGHYVNIPLKEPQYDPRWDPKRIRVVSRIEDLSEIVKDRSRSDSDRGKALLLLMHFVEDEHAPPHVADNGTRGGNSIQIRYAIAGHRVRGTNLHALWDSVMLETYSRDHDRCWELIASFNTEEHRKAWMKGSPRDWATESLTIAKDAFRHPEKKRELQSGDVLDDAYQNRFLPVMAERVCQSGVRLAFLLNSLLGHK